MCKKLESSLSSFPNFTTMDVGDGCVVPVTPLDDAFTYCFPRNEGGKAFLALHLDLFAANGTLLLVFRRKRCKREHKTQTIIHTTSNLVRRFTFKWDKVLATKY